MLNPSALSDTPTAEAWQLPLTGEIAAAVSRRFMPTGEALSSPLLAMLSVCDGNLRLSLNTFDHGLAPALELELTDTWLTSVSQAFDLTLDSQGQLTARRCLVTFSQTSETLTLELRPETRRTVVALPGQRIRAAWRSPLAS